MLTPFSQGNQDFSNRAHAAARSLVYPKIFDCDGSLLSFDDASVSAGGEKAILDGQMAIDRLVKVTVNGLREPIEHTVQERFRKPRYAPFRDITITEWNHASGEKSELYKLKCGMFLYGYYDDQQGKFGEVIAVDTAALLVAMSSRKLKYTVEENPRTMQTFVCLKFDHLIDAGLALWSSKQHLEKQIASAWESSSPAFCSVR